jgi:hypothetical protein
MQQIIEAPDGYSRLKNPPLIRLIPVTVDEAKAWGEWPNDRTPSLYMLDRYGKAKSVRRNGKIQTWKRDASRISIPLKYGFYEAFRLDEHAINRGELLRAA